MDGGLDLGDAVELRENVNKAYSKGFGGKSTATSRVSPPSPASKASATAPPPATTPKVDSSIALFARRFASGGGEGDDAALVYRTSWERPVLRWRPSAAAHAAGGEADWSEQPFEARGTRPQGRSFTGNFSWLLLFCSSLTGVWRPSRSQALAPDGSTVPSGAGAGLHKVAILEGKIRVASLFVLFSSFDFMCKRLLASAFTTATNGTTRMGAHSRCVKPLTHASCTGQ